MNVIWKKIYSNRVLIYEGYTVNGKAYGTGTSFYSDGKPLHEGEFGLKGLLKGREYYPNGRIRFEGTYKLNRAYGPNEPLYGTWYSESGEELFNGQFTVTHGGVGYPNVVEPEGYGTAMFPEVLGSHTFMWEDARALGIEWK